MAPRFPKLPRRAIGRGRRRREPRQRAATTPGLDAAV